MKITSLLAIGGILLFAVNGHPAFLDLRVVGLILIARGAAGLWTGIGPAGRARYIKQFKVAVARGTTVFDSLTADLARDDRTRTSLDELLAQPRRPQRR